MDEPLSSRTNRPRDAHVVHQLMVYQTACALAESASLAEAAPRMLEAVCTSLGWGTARSGRWTAGRRPCAG